MSFENLEQRIAFHKREIWLRASLDAETGKPKLDFCVLNKESSKAYLIQTGQVIDIKPSLLAAEGNGMFTKSQPFIKPFFCQDVPQCFQTNMGYEKMHHAMVPLVFKKLLLDVQNTANAAHWKAKSEQDAKKANVAQCKTGGAEL